MSAVQGEPVQHPSDESLFERAFAFAQEAIIFDLEAQAMRNGFTSVVLALWARYRTYPSPAALFTAFGVDPMPYVEFFDSEHFHRLAAQLGHAQTNGETPPLETGA